jgi:hypothetical protein
MYSFKLEMSEDSMVIIHKVWLKYFLGPFGPFETCLLRFPRPINSPILGRDFIQQGDFWLDLNRAHFVTFMRKMRSRNTIISPDRSCIPSTQKEHVRVFDETVNSLAFNLDELLTKRKVEVVQSASTDSGRMSVSLQGVKIHLQPHAHYLPFGHFSAAILHRCFQ